MSSPTIRRQTPDLLTSCDLTDSKGLGVPDHGAKFIAAYILAISASAALLAITGLKFVNALRLNTTGTRKNNTVAALVSLIVFVVYIVYLALISANGKNDVVSISSWDSGYGSSDVYVGAPGGGLSTSPEDQWSGSTINNGGVVAPGMIAALCTIALALFDSFHLSQDQDDKRSSA
ncbi:unnamed protein product [Jaminaea pallidilutea]